MNYKKNHLFSTAAIAVFSSFFLIISLANANNGPCEGAFDRITNVDSFREAMTKGMHLSVEQVDLWNFYRRNGFDNFDTNTKRNDLSDVSKILEKYPELSKLSIREQRITFSIRALIRNEKLSQLLNKFRKISLNKINNLFQIEDNLNYWTTILIYQKPKRQGLSKAQRKSLKQQYSQEFLSYLDSFINSETRQFIANSSQPYRERAIILYRILDQIRASLEKEGKNTELVSRAMVDVIETVGFHNEAYVGQLKSSNAIENIEGVRNILVERDIVSFELGFKEGSHFIELKKSLLKKEKDDEVNKKETLQDIEGQLLQMNAAIDNKAKNKQDTETLRLRALSLQESPFRSCLGGDCTTSIYFNLGFDPNFLFFTLTNSHHRSSGQVTVVLGEARDLQGQSVKTAFVDNIHNFPLHQIEPVLEGIRLSLVEYGYRLTLPKDVNMDGNGLSNEMIIRDYVKGKLLPHLTKGFTQFTPHENDYPFKNQYYRDYSKVEMVDFEKASERRDDFSIISGERYIPRLSPQNLSVRSLYEEVFALQHSKREEDQIR